MALLYIADEVQMPLFLKMSTKFLEGRSCLWKICPTIALWGVCTQTFLRTVNGISSNRGELGRGAEGEFCVSNIQNRILRGPAPRNPDGFGGSPAFPFQHTKQTVLTLEKPCGNGSLKAHYKKHFPKSGLYYEKDFERGKHQLSSICWLRTSNH